MPPSAPRLERMRPEQAERLWDDVAALKERGGALAPVTVVGPSMYANLSLRQELARRGFANVRFAILSQVSELLGAPLVIAERPEVRPLKPVIEATAIREALKRAGADSRLSDFADNSAAIRSLRATFRELRAAPDSALDVLSQSGELRADTVALYRRFERLTRDGFYDSESLARAAADAVADGRAAGLNDLGFIIFYRVSAMSAGEIRLVRALFAAGKASAALGVAGDDEADAPVKALARRLSESPPEIADAAADAPPPASADNTHLLIAPTPREEIRWVIRRAVERAERGTPLHKIAILYRKASPYSSMIREELELAGLPVAGPDPAPLSRTAVGRALVGLVNLAAGDFARDDVMSWLTGCPVKPPGMSARRFVPSLWDAVSKKAGVTRGLAQWERRLSVHAKGLERQANTDESELSAPRAAGMRAEAKAARDLAAFVQTLADDVKPPPDGSSWDDFRKWAWDAFEKFSASRLDIPDSEVAALDKIEMRMNELTTARAIDESPTFDAFRQALNEALSASAGRLGQTGAGVFAATFASAAAMRFDAVYFVGMIEGAAPPALRESPLMPDRDRRAAGGADAGLPLLSERRARERYEFLAAMATSPHRTLSYPVADPVGGRENHPSRWMLEQASALNGARVAASALGSLADAPWLTVVKSPETALESAAEFAPADVHDYDLERIWRWTKDGLPARCHPIAESGALAVALDMSRMRNSARLTEWDGDLSSARALPSMARRPRYSPSSLERWASCPFSYFLSYGLRIGALDKPEDEYFLSPLERGSLIHAILEKFVERMRKAGGIPKPGAAWSADCRETLRDVAAQEFDRTESEGFFGKALSWRLEKDEIMADLDTFLIWDSDLRARFGVSPFMVEARFGMGGGSPDVEIDAGGETIRFRGLADRIDAGEGDAPALVMDYKTGSASPYNVLDEDPLDRGKKLQLAVYSLAAKRILGRDDAPVIAAYAFVSARGGFQLRPKEPIDYGSNEMSARFRYVAGEIVEGIRKGVFPANPGGMGYGGYENCRFCDFDSLCPSRRDVMWLRKRSDPKAARYASLADEERG